MPIDCIFKKYSQLMMTIKKTNKKTPTFLAFRGNVNLALAIHRLAAVLPVFSWTCLLHRDCWCTLHWDSLRIEPGLRPWPGHYSRHAFCCHGGQPESRIWTVRCNSITFGSSDVFTCTIKVYLTVKTMDILVS